MKKRRSGNRWAEHTELFAVSLGFEAAASVDAAFFNARDLNGMEWTSTLFWSHSSNLPRFSSIQAHVACASPAVRSFIQACVHLGQPVCPKNIFFRRRN
jgi:hypothetical protein